MAKDAIIVSAGAKVRSEQWRGLTLSQIGGSNAGLMCGVMLKHHGYNVTVLEQETSPSRQGYDAGITVGPAVQDFLKEHDRVNREMVITCPPGVKININGEPKAQRGQTMVNTSWGLLVSVISMGLRPRRYLWRRNLKMLTARRHFGSAPA
jgi:hypothetical protein